MKKSITIAALASGAALITVVAFAAQRQPEPDDDYAALSAAKITLTQAITAAEQHVQGRAIKAELENENGRLVYEVEVVKQNMATDVKVDSADGRIVSAKADPQDRDEGHERGGHHDQRK